MMYLLSFVLAFLGGLAIGVWSAINGSRYPLLLALGVWLIAATMVVG
jgi:hypothetical protein